MQHCSWLRRHRLLIALLPLFSLSTCAPAIGQKKPVPRQYIFSRSTTQSSSASLGVTCVPAYVTIGASNRTGIYITSGSSGLTSRMGLSPGCVLLTLDNRVVESASAADSILNAKSGGTLEFTYARLVRGVPQVIARSCPYSQNPVISSGGVIEESIGPGISEMPASSGGLGASRSKSEVSIGELENYMFSLINQDRSKHGCASIAQNSALAALARNYAEYMLKKNTFGHFDPDGRDPQARAKQAGIRCGVYENLSFTTRGFIADRDGVSRAEAQMMSEPPDQHNHRYNILLPQHKYVGVGIARSAQKLIMVQEFSDEDP